MISLQSLQTIVSFLAVVFKYISFGARPLVPAVRVLFSLMNLRFLFNLLISCRAS